MQAGSKQSITSRSDLSAIRLTRVGNLIVFNDDEIAPRRGFGLHQHENVEIVSYIREGTVTHRDDQGNMEKQMLETSRL